MATNNAVNVGLSGSIGTGNFVGSTSPTLVTPILGAATATSLAFSPTTGGIIGTTAADSATAGDVGEFVSNSVVYASAVSIPTNVTPVNITSISLTAGDWDVWGNVTFNINTTGVVSLYGWVSSSSATLPDISLASVFVVLTTFAGAVGTAIPSRRFNVSSPTTVYLSAEFSAASGTYSGAGNIFARRRR